MWLHSAHSDRPHVQPTPRYNYDNYVSELTGRLQSAHATARESLLQSKERSKLDYDKQYA